MDAGHIALLANAGFTGCVHDRPSGILEPSWADVAVSQQLKAAGEAVGLSLVDSIVCGYDSRYTSLVERGLI